MREYPEALRCGCPNRRFSTFGMATDCRLTESIRREFFAESSFPILPCFCHLAISASARVPFAGLFGSAVFKYDQISSGYWLVIASVAPGCLPKNLAIIRGEIAEVLLPAVLLVDPDNRKNKRRCSAADADSVAEVGGF